MDTPKEDGGATSRAERHVLVPVEPTQEMLSVRVSPVLRIGHEENSRVQEWRRALYIAMIAAAPPVQMEAVAWRPIETAPKDGTEIIVRMGLKDIRLGWFFAPSSATRGWLDQSSRKIRPTHWIPLPSDHAASPVPSSERDDIIEMCAAKTVSAYQEWWRLQREHQARWEAWKKAGEVGEMPTIAIGSLGDFVALSIRSLKSQPAQEAE